MGLVIHGARRLNDLAPVSIRIDGATIDRVGVPDDSWPAGDDLVDASGKLAFPGFVNAHTHLPMVLLRGAADGVPLSTWLEEHIWPVERALRPDDIYWCALLAIAESVRCGVVAFADMYFHCDGIARAVEESGTRALLSYGMVAPSLAAGGARELEIAERFADAWHGGAGGRIAVAVSPHAIYTCGEDLLRGAAALAERRGLILHTHVSETRGEVESWRAKTSRTPPEELDRLGVFSVPTLAAHCVHATDADLEILARRHVRVAHCPKSNGKLGSGAAPVRAMLDHGIRVAIGTDGAASNDRLDVLEEARFACLLARAESEDARAISASDAVAMATSEGRRALGLPKANLEPGDPADVVLIDARGVHASPSSDGPAMLAFALQASDVTDVFVDGRALLRDRRLLAFDEERVQSEVARLAARLRRN